MAETMEERFAEIEARLTKLEGEVAAAVAEIKALNTPAESPSPPPAPEAAIEPIADEPSDEPVAEEAVND